MGLSSTHTRNGMGVALRPTVAVGMAPGGGLSHPFNTSTKTWDVAATATNKPARSRTNESLDESLYSTIQTGDINGEGRAGRCGGCVEGTAR